jgi:hypothetical protein
MIVIIKRFKTYVSLREVHYSPRKLAFHSGTIMSPGRNNLRLSQGAT